MLKIRFERVDVLYVMVESMVELVCLRGGYRVTIELHAVS
jgi:hypothetical protein